MERTIKNLGLISNIQKLLKKDTKYSICNVGDGNDWEKPCLTSDIPHDFHEWATSLGTLTLEEMFQFIVDNSNSYCYSLIYSKGDDKWSYDAEYKSFDIFTTCERVIADMVEYEYEYSEDQEKEDSKEAHKLYY